MKTGEKNKGSTNLPTSFLDKYFTNHPLIRYYFRFYYLVTPSIILSLSWVDFFLLPPFGPLFFVGAGILDAAGVPASLGFPLSSKRPSPS